jgi:hypothetical protein
LRCLREDLGLSIPRVGVPLEEVAHPLLAKASERFVGEQAMPERAVAPEELLMEFGLLGRNFYARTATVREFPALPPSARFLRGNVARCCS